MNNNFSLSGVVQISNNMNRNTTRQKASLTAHSRRPDDNGRRAVGGGGEGGGQGVSLHERRGAATAFDLQRRCWASVAVRGGHADAC